jgi:ferrochelatase
MTPRYQFSTSPVGLLLVNLGTPDGADVASVRRFLGQFLSDSRVVELPRVVWLPLLYGVILLTRPARSAKAYEAIWDRKKNEGPLKAITRAQAEKLALRAVSGAFGDGSPVMVDFAMRYGSPSIGSKLEALRDRGCERIVLVPLYPQYAASTTASAADAAFAELKHMRWQPAIRVAAPYYDDPVYIEALAESLRSGLASLGFEPEVIVTSFHGLPQAQIDKGDPYKRQCESTWRLLREAVGFAPDRFLLTFQSRFGPTKWTEPYTAQVVDQLAKSGVKRLVITTPGFSADCLETIEEIGVEICNAFLAMGGKKFARIPCLNDSDVGIRVIEHVARREISGWV